MGGLWTGVRPVHIARASRMVSDYSGMLVQPHKAIVGANAFAHESGIHQDGMLKSRDTYEIMSPETIGLTRADAAGIVLGKHSGRHALGTRLAQLGWEGLDKAQLNDVFKRFKALADKKKVTREQIGKGGHVHGCPAAVRRGGRRRSSAANSHPPAQASRWAVIPAAARPRPADPC